ncbi:hypothetical protein M501DRAFT_951869 [Patellaria atrata CBS 101060]|uniref:Uncharacterized protein n=1 Tax=Patellaria atrata CBS 101060 TaxID=1346257 RepID=A0A9P4SDX5_9PEZI|nr:hypothetical protein M501DRAFT_951869 [Patellaria atrata CBS 101060]
MEKEKHSPKSSTFRDKRENPPGYDQLSDPIPDLTTRLRQLDFTKVNPTPSPDECVAHLKLLEAFYQLREDISTLESNSTDPRPSQTTQADARVREKKWEVYVTRAVERFTKWWEDAIPRTSNGVQTGMLTRKKLGRAGSMNTVVQKGSRLHFGKTLDLPPLDVLMVWHAYLLNPRLFFEDCVRYDIMDLYATPFPWREIDSCIDCITFEYTLSQETHSKFEQQTGIPWDNRDLGDKIIECVSCKTKFTVPWSTEDETNWKTKIIGTGFADKAFSAKCVKCNKNISHETLRMQRLNDDLNLLINDDVPLPGTIFGVSAQPRRVTRFEVGRNKGHYPNTLIMSDSSLRSKLLSISNPNNLYRNSSGLTGITSAFDEVLSKSNASRRDRTGIRRVMSRYWYNSSPFGLDLVGAVIRQGTFINKMHKLDWLHSPALTFTMQRSLKKYDRFLSIIASNKKKMAVPTLDVDLAWHTHQLNPASYCNHCLVVSWKLIDHDDKVEEATLSEGFLWTSAVYAARYGESYSACLCWYCEAVREAHSSPSSLILHPSRHFARSRLHKASDDLTMDPVNSPHISTHNAVKNYSAEALAKARVHEAKLEEAYNKACARARKNGREEPKKEEAMLAPWGYPIIVPVYVPFEQDPAISTDSSVYAVDPCNVATTGYGACAMYTCGGAAGDGGGCGAPTMDGDAGDGGGCGRC